MITRRVWLYGSAAAVIVCLLAAPVLAGATVTGDRSAYDEVVAAFTKLFSLPFRAKTAGRQGQVLFEYAPPNNWHFNANAQGGSYGYENIHVGGQVATRGSIPGTTPEWRCRTAKAGDRPFFDPTKATGTYNASRGPDTTIDGTLAHTIFFVEGDKKETIYVGIQNGLPKRVITGAGDTVDYYDYGAHVAIALPPCAPQ